MPVSNSVHVFPSTVYHATNTYPSRLLRYRPLFRLVAHLLSKFSVRKSGRLSI